MSDLTDLQKGNRLLVEGEFVKAIEAFERHAEEYQAEAAVAYERIAECLCRGNVVSVPQVVTEGITLVSAGDLRGAELYYRKALLIDPDLHGALVGLASLPALGDRERSELLSRAIAQQPQYLPLLELGGIYARNGEHDAAYDLFKRANSLKPRERGSYERLAALCEIMGRTGEANEWREAWANARARKRRVDGRHDS